MRFWPVVYAGVGLLPTVLALWFVLRGSPVPAPLLLGPAVVLTIVNLAHLHATRRLSPLQRGRVLGGECWWRNIAYAYSLSPLAPWLAETWHSYPWLERYQFWLAFVLVAWRWTPLGRFLEGARGVLPNAFLMQGLFVFLVAMFRGDQSLAVFAALLAGFSLPLELLKIRSLALPSDVMRRLDAQRFGDRPGEYRAEVLRSWSGSALHRQRSPVAIVLYRLVRGPWLRPRAFDHRRFAEGTRQYKYDERARRLAAWNRLPPDLSLVHTLCYEGFSAAQATKQSEQLEKIHPTVARTGAAAFHWTNLGEAVMSSVRLLYPHTTAREQRALDLADAHLAEARGDIHDVLGQKEEAARENLAARRLRLQHGLVNMVAEELSGQAAATVAATMSQRMRPQQVLEELEPLAAHPGLVPLTRRMALTGISTCYELLGDREAARRYRREAEAVPVRRRDALRIYREARQAGTEPAWPPSHLDSLAIYELINVGADRLFGVDLYTVDLGERRIPPLVVARHNEQAGKLAEAGIKLWMAGQAIDGAAKVREAADLLERENQPVHACWALLDLGFALRRLAPAAAYADLARGLEIQQRLRGAVADADLRLASGVTTQRIVTAMISLLAEAGPHPGDGWPERRAATVFALSETARSRVLLELLGEPLLRQGRNEPMTYQQLHEFLQAESARTIDPEEA
ncbi:hypothetical protein [Nonomuraea sp. NPDC049400]|uniref:hypothetical protein n=1 Tax=Nonomuraea sp. NPDC049400 TaxID=3364352 RepID=UPI0037A7C5D2